MQGKKINLKLGHGWIAVFVFIISLLFYWKTLAPTVMWGDPAKLTISAYTLHLRIYQGNHLLRNLLGYTFGKLPVGDFAYKQNLLSAVFAAITLSILYFISIEVIKNKIFAIIAPLSLMVSHTFWWESVIAESYTLYALSMVSLIYIAWMWTKNKGKKWLYLFSFVLGLGFCNNESIIVYLPAFLYMFASSEMKFFDLKQLFMMFFWFIIGLSPWIYVAVETKELYSSIIPYVLGPIIDADISSHSLSGIVRMLWLLPVYLIYQFPIVGFALGIFGGWKFFQKTPKYALFLFLILLINVLLAGAYMKERQHNVLIVSYPIFSIWIAYAFDWLWNKFKEKRDLESPMGQFQRKMNLIFILLVIFTICLPLYVYYNAPKVLAMMDYSPLKIRTLPFRDNNRYFFLPDKRNYYGPETFAKEVYKIVEPNSIIFSDFTPIEVLKYYQIIEHKRPDIKLIPVTFKKPAHQGPLDLKVVTDNIDKRPIYIVDIDDYKELYNISGLQKNYKFMPAGPIFRIVRK